MGLILPEHYDPRLSVRETQEAIKYIRCLLYTSDAADEL